MTNKRLTKKQEQRRENNRKHIADIRTGLAKEGVSSTVIYFLPKEMEQAKVLLPKIMIEPFSPARKLQQLKERKEAPPAENTSHQQSGQLDLGM
jgi:hypothetical protein